MDERLRTFKRIIRECNYDNTYKMAWARSLVEIALRGSHSNEDPAVITLKEMAENYLKYYWNQTIFFHLVQGSNLQKPPEVLTYTTSLINEYFRTVGNTQPLRFERIEDSFVRYPKLGQYKEEIVTRISRTLKQDVSWRFINLPKEQSHTEIYVFDKNLMTVTMKADMLELLKENHEDLFELIDYRWGMILETFNSSPRINRKVRILDEQDVRRNSLNGFRKYLDPQNPERICFICGERIDEENQVSIDHVIPWSYMYSDDLWNLVYVHKSCNSSKSNTIPTPEDIRKLKLRNQMLLETLKNTDYKALKLQQKKIDELEIAIARDYVDKFWVGCK